MSTRRKPMTVHGLLIPHDVQSAALTWMASHVDTPARREAGAPTWFRTRDLRQFLEQHLPPAIAEVLAVRLREREAKRGRFRDLSGGRWTAVPRALPAMAKDISAIMESQPPPDSVLVSTAKPVLIYEFEVPVEVGEAALAWIAAHAAGPGRLRPTPFSNKALLSFLERYLPTSVAWVYAERLLVRLRRAGDLRSAGRGMMVVARRLPPLPTGQ
jgi:hypothetical protein